MSPHEAHEVAAIERTLSRFFLHLDLREHRELSAMMADDGIWERQGKKLQGPAMTLAAMNERPDGRTTLHVVTNWVIDMNGADAAHASFYMVAFRHDGTEKPTGAVRMDLPASAQIFRARLKRIGADWRIQHMYGTPVLAR